MNQRKVKLATIKTNVKRRIISVNVTRLNSPIKIIVHT